MGVLLGSTFQENKTCRYAGNVSIDVECLGRWTCTVDVLDVFTVYRSTVNMYLSLSLSLCIIVYYVQSTVV